MKVFKWVGIVVAAGVLVGIVLAYTVVGDEGAEAQTNFEQALDQQDWGVEHGYLDGERVKQQRREMGR